MIELSGVALLHPRSGSSLVEDATLIARGGQVVLVVAAAGLGSSRLMAAMIGEADCAAGQINLLGHDVGKLRRASLRKLRRRVGIVPQELSLLEDRSAQLNVVMPLEIDGVPRSVSIVRAIEVLDQLGLTDEASLPIDALSRSVRQRVAVARALIRKPDVILADHPTSDQDAAGAALVCRALDKAAAEGAACIVFSRDPMLRVHAEAAGWGQWALCSGQLLPLHLGAEASLDELSIALDGELPASLAPEQVLAPMAAPQGTPPPRVAPVTAPYGSPLVSGHRPFGRAPTVPSALAAPALSASVAASALPRFPIATTPPAGELAQLPARSASSAQLPAVDEADFSDFADEASDDFGNVLPFPGASLRAGAR